MIDLCLFKWWWHINNICIYTKLLFFQNLLRMKPIRENFSSRTNLLSWTGVTKKKEKLKRNCCHQVRMLVTKIVFFFFFFFFLIYFNGLFKYILCRNFNFANLPLFLQQCKKFSGKSFWQSTCFNKCLKNVEHPPV